MKTFLALWLFTLLAGCATGRYVAHQDYTGKDAATVYLIRPRGLGTAVNMRAYVDDQLIGRLGPGEYERLSLAPGQHSISTHIAAVIPTLIAGQTAYYKLWYPVAGGAHIVPISAKDGRALLARVKPLQARATP